MSTAGAKREGQMSWTGIQRWSARGRRSSSPWTSLIGSNRLRLGKRCGASLGSGMATESRPRGWVATRMCSAWRFGLYSRWPLS